MNELERKINTGLAYLKDNEILAVNYSNGKMIFTVKIKNELLQSRYFRELYIKENGKIKRIK